MLTDEVTYVIKNYIEKGEEIKELSILQYNERTYREIVFTKKGLKLLREGIKGYIFIDNDNKIVTSKNIIVELCRLAHFHETFFSQEKNKGILKALESKDDVTSGRLEFEDISLGLDFLKQQAVEGTDRIKEIVRKLTDLKEIIDNKTSNLKQTVEENRDKPFSEDTLKVIYPLYIEILKMNFENIKLIASSADFYDSVQVEAEKKRKKWANRIKKNVVGNLMKVSDKIGFFKRVIRAYGDVVNMSVSQYLKFLTDINKNKIEDRTKLVRS